MQMHNFATVKVRGRTMVDANDVIVMLYKEASLTRNSGAIADTSVRERELVALVLEYLAERFSQLL